MRPPWPSREHEQHAGSGQPLFVLIRKFADLRNARGWARQHTIPIITQGPGFRGIYIAGADGDETEAAVVTLFDTRENALQSHEQVMQIIREKGRDVAPTPPRVVTGQTLVLAAS